MRSFRKIKVNLRFSCRPWAAATLLALGIFLVYLPALDGEFQWDDHNNLRENPALRGSLLDSVRFWPSRALTMASFWANYRLGGLSVRGYHLANLAIHWLGSLGLYFILRRLFARHPRGEEGALLGAVFFAFHPLQTQAVAYIAQRYSSLAGALVLWSVFLLLVSRETREEGSRRGGRWASAGSLFLFAAAILARESAAVVPWVLAAIVFLKPGIKLPRLRELAPWLMVSLLAAGPFLLTAHGAGGMDNFYYRSGIDPGGAPLKFGAQGVEISGRGQYALTQIEAVRSYLRLLFLPIRQAPLHDLAPAVGWSLSGAASAVLVGGLLLFGAALARKRIWAGAGILWFFGCLLPTSSVIVLWPFMAEHHLYLPLAGAALVFAGLVLSAPGFPSRRVGAAAVLLLGLLTLLRAQLWRTEVGIWRDNARLYPEMALVRYSLGGALIKAGAWEEGLAEAEEAARLHPGLNTWPNRWGALYNLGRLEEALAAARIWAAGEPRSAPAALALGKTWLRLRRPEEAAAPLELAARLKPGSPEPFLLMAYVRKAQGDEVGEKELLEKALRLDPGNESALIRLASLAACNGDEARAESLYRSGLVLCPDSILLNYNFALFLGAAGRGEEAAGYRERSRAAARGSCWEFILPLNPEP